MPFRPQFGPYFTGPWPYCSSEGVGLAFSGKPTDPHEFIETLQGFGCSPSATRRILDDLETGKTRCTTVVSYLRFDKIGDCLAKVGVKMNIVPPKEGGGSVALDMAVMGLHRGNPSALDGLTADEQNAVKQQLAQFQASLVRLPHEFGKFA